VLTFDEDDLPGLANRWEDTLAKVNVYRSSRLAYQTEWAKNWLKSKGASYKRFLAKKRVWYHAIAGLR
jgi:hypothetical protein